MTPSFGYSFQPNLNQIKTLKIPNNPDALNYSPFERSIYQNFNTNDASLFTFGMNNTLELKQKSDKDTITGFKKTKLLDNFSITGNYDFKKDTMKLSNLNTSLRISPLRSLNFVATGNFSPYNWDDSTGESNNEFAIN